MCLIIEKKPEQEISTEFFKDVWYKNDDGVGLMWHGRRGVTGWKGLTLDEFLKVYDRVKHKHLMIHFRFRTQGKVCVENSHPFQVSPNIWMMHNGSMASFWDKDGHKSDTACFVEEKMMPLIKEKGEDFVRTTEFLETIAGAVTYSNKLVFIDRKGFIIPKENLWVTTLDGLKVSNDYAFTLNNPKHQAGYKSIKRNSWDKGENIYPHNNVDRKLTDPYMDDDDENYPFENYGYGDYSNQNTSPAKNEKVVGINDNKPKLITDQTNPPSATSLITKDGKPLTENHENADWAFFNEMDFTQLSSYCLNEPDTMAAVIMTMRKEILDYGHPQNKSSASGR